LNQADDAALVSAKAVWYSNSDLEGELAAFLSCHTDEVERSACRVSARAIHSLYVYPISACQKLLNALELVAHWTCGQPVTPRTVTPLRRRRDELAVSWGLSEGLGLKAQILMPFQTRHYEAEQRAMFS
jgi:hypothetical protein